MKGETASPAKITRPDISGILLRKRLFRLLNEYRKHPITWICAPAGSGKTTLIASYLDEHKLQGLWYQVDRSDDDPAAFFYYMGLAAKKTAPRYRKPLPLLTPEYLPGLHTFTLRYFEKLYDRVVRKRGQGFKGSRVRGNNRKSTIGNHQSFLLVFDNYQEVPASSILHEIICRGMEIIPQGITIVVISRSEPPDAFARLRANNHIEILDFDKLRLTEEETAGLMRLKVKGKYPKACVRKIHIKTKGWAAGIVLMLEKARRGGIDAFNEVDTDTIFNYFMSEMFQKTDVDTRVFLLKTAFFQNIDVKMADKLTGLNNSDRIFSELTRNNYFTEKRLHSSAPVFQYHPLFKEFLLLQLKDFFTGDDIAELQKKTASVLEESGRIEDALELFSEAGQWHDTARLLLENAPNIIAQGRGRTVERWIRSMPKTMVEQEPRLLYWLGVCHSPFSQHQSIEHFKKAFELFRAQKDATGTFLSLSGVFESIAYGLNYFQQFDRWISELYELIDQYKSFPSEEIEARIATNMLYAILYRQPQHPDFEKWEARALSFLRGNMDVNIKMTTLIALICYRLFSGELEKASVLFNLSREVSGSPGISPLFLITLKDFEAFYCWLTSDFEKCEKAANEGLKLASSTGVHLIDYFILGHSAANALSSGDLDAAEKYLGRMSSCLEINLPWIQNLYHSVAGWKALLKKDFLQALTHTETALNLAVDIGMPQNRALNHLGKALALHETGKYGAAEKQISEAHKICSAVKVL